MYVIDHRRDVIGRANYAQRSSPDGAAPAPLRCAGETVRVRGRVGWMDGGSWLLTSKHAGAEAKARDGTVYDS